MDKTNVTVTMPVTEYERLLDIEMSFNKYIDALERANKNGKANMTQELKRIIESIYD